MDGGRVHEGIGGPTPAGTLRSRGSSPVDSEMPVFSRPPHPRVPLVGLVGPRGEWDIFQSKPQKA